MSSPPRFGLPDVAPNVAFVSKTVLDLEVRANRSLPAYARRRPLTMAMVRRLHKDLQIPAETFSAPEFRLFVLPIDNCRIAANDRYGQPPWVSRPQNIEKTFPK
jgi:hypothetical protein